MAAFGLHQINTLRKTQPAKNSFGLPVVVPRPPNIKKIACRRADQRGSRRSHQHVIGLVQTDGQLPKYVLLRVLRSDGFDEAAERR